MNLILVVLFLVTMAIFVGVFVGLICLQVHISKNNKKGKFAIPIIMFLLPFIAIVLIISFGAVKDSGTREVETSVSTKVVEEDGDVIIEEEIVEEDSNVTTYFGGSIIAIAYTTIVIGWPTAIITLIIELVYRSKRKQIADEDVIDIQNL